MSRKTIFALPSNLYEHCRRMLCRCREFESYQTLRTVFVTEELVPFRIGLRSADNVEQLEGVMHFPNIDRVRILNG